MKNTRLISGALAAVMLVSGAALPVSADNVAATSATTATVDTLGGLAAPKFTGAAKGRTHIKLNWSKVGGASGYKIYRKVNGKYKCIKTIKSGDTLSVKLGDFDTHTRYTFKVRAYKKQSGKTTYSKFSAAKTVTTKYGSNTKDFSTKAISLRYEPDKWEVVRYASEEPGVATVRIQYIGGGDSETYVPETGCWVSSHKISGKEKGKPFTYFVDKFVNEDAEYHVYYDVEYGKLGGKKCARLYDIDKGSAYPDRILVWGNGYWYSLSHDIDEDSLSADDCYQLVYGIYLDLKLK